MPRPKVTLIPVKKTKPAEIELVNESAELSGYVISLQSLDKIIKAHSKPGPIYQKTYLVNPKKPYLKNECLVEVDGLPRGIYRIEMTSDCGEIVSNLLYVSNLIAITEYLPDNKLRIVVVDSVSGHPVPKAKVDKRLKSLTAALNEQ